MGPYNHSWSVCLMFSEMFLKSKKKYTEVYTISKEKSTKQGRRKVWKSRGRLLFRRYWCICHFLKQTLLVSWALKFWDFKGQLAQIMSHKEGPEVALKAKIRLHFAVWTLQSWCICHFHKHSHLIIYLSFWIKTTWKNILAKSAPWME